MWKRWMRYGALTWAVTLPACGMLGGVGKESPPAPVVKPMTLVSATGATVTVDDARSGSPVEMRADQQLIVRLRYEGTSKAQWELVDFTPGSLASPDRPRFESRNGDSESLGGDQIWRFKPAGAGQMTLNFAYRPPRSLEPATRTVTFPVTVR